VAKTADCILARAARSRSLFRFTILPSFEIAEPFILIIPFGLILLSKLNISVIRVELDSWKRGEYVIIQDWATMPGESKPVMKPHCLKGTFSSPVMLKS
jgi:hypothetical protein